MPWAECFKDVAFPGITLFEASVCPEPSPDAAQEYLT